MPLHVACLLHAPFEGPGTIASWAVRRGFTLREVHVYREGQLPGISDFDFLVVMGGPMSVHDEAAHPWLIPEKALVRACLEARKFILGVCLGSQLVAQALGARVYRNTFKEIGWFPVECCGGSRKESLFADLPDQFMAFHWHGETYDLPAGAIHLARSEACSIQAFEHPSALGLQFHLEMTASDIRTLDEACAADIGTGPYEQSPAQMRAQENLCGGMEQLLGRVLDRIAARIGSPASS